MIENTSKKPKTAIRMALEHIAVLIFWLLVWGIASYSVGEELLLPSPSTVLQKMGEMIVTPTFWKITATSLARIIIGILSALVIGAVLAFLTASIPLLHTLFKPLITVIRSTPVASFIILIVLWVGRDTLPTVIAILMVLPVVWGNMHEGICNTDKELIEVGKAYEFSLWKRIKRLYLPYITPYFTSAARTSIGLAWKAGIAAEVITYPQFSIGTEMSNTRYNLETAELFAWTLTVILLSFITEMAFSWLFMRDKKATKGGKTHGTSADL